MDSTRFMTSSLSILANIAEGIHKIKCASCNTCFLKYANAKVNLIEYKRITIKYTVQQNTIKVIKKSSTNKFILLLQKAFYPYENISDLEKFNETLLPEKEYFYNNLNMEDLTDVDCKCRKIVSKDCKK